MGVQRQIAGEPGQQVLAVRDMSQHGMPGEVRGRVCGHPQFAVGRHAIAQRLVEAAGQCVHGVTLGHASIVLVRTPSQRTCNGSTLRRH